LQQRGEAEKTKIPPEKNKAQRALPLHQRGFLRIA
jgi:hypothetical protein